MSRPVAPTNTKFTGDLKDLPPLLIGGAVFNQQFNDNPELLPAEEIIKIAFSQGLRAIDTSPYYGPSELIIGEALSKLNIPRDEYFLVTKAGRVKLDDFDYDPISIEKSVKRSLERFHTTYLDLVYLHDVEFVPEDEILNGLKKLKELKGKGIIKNFGITGYPVDFLYNISLKAKNDPEIGSLDAILSYSNYNLQNESLKPYVEKFYSDAGLKKLINGSILSMSLLRSGSTHTFHPASQELKDTSKSIAKYLHEKYDVELADLATRYAIREFKGKGSIALGVSNVEELKNAIDQYWNVIDNTIDDDELIKIVKEKYGVHLNEVWESGISHDLTYTL